MARLLKTYITSLGFFDLAVAAPSMKAALEAWGTERNLFHLGFAQETDDPKIVAATMKKPGMVLRRAVGSKDLFSENPALPRELLRSSPKPAEPRKAKEKPKKTARPRSAPDPKAQKAAIIEFAKEKARREREQEKVEADREKREAQEAREEEKRQWATDRAQAVLDRARERHESNMKIIEREREAVDRKADAESERWRREKAKLEEAVREAGR